MFIELIDLLRCPREHDDSWLVAAFTRMDQRFVIQGKLGCPVCGESYRIENGIADLRGSEAVGDTPDNRKHLEDALADRTSPDDVMRFAAMLGLTRPGSLVVMEGETAGLAVALSEMTEARVIALNPPGQLSESERVGVVLGDRRIPLAPASVDGIVLGSQTASFADSGRVLKPGGRFIAAAHTDIGPRFRELARDERHVVAESIGPLIPLTR